MRRRKSSCPDIDHRRTSLATPSGKNGVKLDLYIEDDELYTGSGMRHRTPSPTANLSHHSSPDRRTSSLNIEDLAEEVLCLRLLSTRTRYRFGGLQIHIISPVFNVDKLFNVEFDQDSQVSLIKSQQSNGEQLIDHNESSNGMISIDPKMNGGKSATIVISPDFDETDTKCSNGNGPSFSADLTLYEEHGGCSPKKQFHVIANTLNEANECEVRKTSIPVTSSPITSVDESTSVKFDNVKVYANIDRTSLIESIDLETKQNIKGNKGGKSKIGSLRRHTHYYCYIPSTLSQSTSSAANDRPISHEDLTRDYSDSSNGSTRRMSAHTLRRFMAKKVNDTIHSAARVKKIFSDSFTMFKS